MKPSHILKRHTPCTPRTGRAIFFCVAFAGVACAAGTAAQAQRGGFDIVQSTIKSRQIIERAVSAYGGEDFLNGINNVEYTLATTMRFDKSSARPSGISRDHAYRRRIRFQIEQKNFAWLTDRKDKDTTECLTSCYSHFEFLVLGDRKHLSFPDAHIASRGFAPDLLTTSQRDVPHLVVRELNANKDKLVWVGQERGAGGLNDIVVYPEGFAGHKEFHFSDRSGLLVKFVQPATSAFGDTENWNEIGGYRKRGPTFVPTQYKRHLGGVGLIEAKYVNFDLNAELSNHMFLPPASYPVFDNTPRGPTRLTEIAPHVYVIQYGNNALVVEFDDYLILVDMPSGRLEEFRKLLSEKFGKKPIRYVVPLVDYSLHSAGLREFVAAGVPILAHENDVARYKKKLAGHFALNPDELARNPRTAKFESVSGRRIFDDGTTRLEFLSIGPVSIADDMLIAYLPKYGIVFSSSLFSMAPNAMPAIIPEPYKNNARRNLSALERTGIAVKRIYTVHSNKKLDLDIVRKLIDSH